MQSPAGYAWAHNSVPYFSQYHEVTKAAFSLLHPRVQGKEIGYWFTLCAILGGSVGVVGGGDTSLLLLLLPHLPGHLSDRVVARLGLHSRLWLLSIATVPPSLCSPHHHPPSAPSTTTLPAPGHPFRHPDAVPGASLRLRYPLWILLLWWGSNAVITVLQKYTEITCSHS